MGLTSSSTKFLICAVAIASLSFLIFGQIIPAAIALSAWLLFSGAMIGLNQVADGSRFEHWTHHVHTFMSEMNSWIIKASLFPFTFFNASHAPVGNLKGRPILMINGYLSFGTTWMYQKTKLAEAGLGPIYTMNIGTGRSIDTYAQEVREKVREIQEETKRTDLVLIGHSKGGLVSAHFATQYAREIGSQVTDVITIGSPLAGTPAAHFGLGLDASEMRLESPFHQSLRERIAKAAATRFFHIASTADPVVPLSSALMGNHFERQMFVKDLGHVALLLSSRVVGQIRKWLEQPIV
jgi:pimeloyl-ACP methyl ester carboxylesterase